MKIAYLKSLLCILEVSILKVDSDEISLVITLKVCEYLDHPIGHSSSQIGCDLVISQAICRVYLLLVHSQVLVDVFKQFVINVDVLALIIVCLRSI
jgi:hypothetical protein